MLRRRCSDFPYLNRFVSMRSLVGNAPEPRGLRFPKPYEFNAFKSEPAPFEQVDVGRRTACRSHY